MSIYIVTRSNYYPETRVQDGAEWTEILQPAYRHREAAKARIEAEIKNAEWLRRNDSDLPEPDYSYQDDPEHDTYSVMRLEVVG